MEPLILRTGGDVAEWVLAGGTIALAVCTLLLGAIALFQDQLHEWLRRPELVASINMAPPDCHMITLGTGPSAIATFYMRIRVRNDGHVPAKDVEVFAAELRIDQSGQWTPLTSFLPMNLVWSHMQAPGRPPVIYFPMISPHMYKHCDLANIIDPARRAGHIEENPGLRLSPTQTSARFNVMVYPNHKGEIVGPGRYQLDLVVAASNAQPTRFVAEINLTGNWYANESQMLASGVSATIHPA
jgi:hypothetical protein